MNIALSILPKVSKLLSQPKLSSLLYIVLDLIENWTKGIINSVYNHLNRRFPIPSSTILSISLCLKLVYLYRPKYYTNT
jgi:hypothetical protein